MRLVSGFSVAIISVALSYASFPPLGFSLLAWVALTPLMAFLSYSGPLHAFVVATFMGASLCSLYVHWLNAVPGFPFAAFLFIVTYTGLFFGFFGLLFTIVSRNTPWPTALVAPSLWVALEYLRSNLSFLAIPVGLMGHTQHANLPIIQVASLTSVYGVSFLLVLVNSANCELIKLYVDRKRGNGSRERFQRMPFYSVAGTALIVMGVAFWGQHELSTNGTPSKNLLTVSLVQGNIPQAQKWDVASRREIMTRYSELTMKAASAKPDMIIWPESATPGYLRSDPIVYRTVGNLVRETHVPLLLGSATPAKTTRGGEKVQRLVNSAFLVRADGKAERAYQKIRLLPFGEYLPLEGKFPWPDWLVKSVPKDSIFIHGTVPVVLEIPKGKFGVVICWENLFPDLFRRFVKRGAQFMVNLTNEAWFDGTVAPRLFMSMSVFRAVENRVSLLRCANTGISGMIDPHGRVLKTLKDDAGRETEVTGILTAAVPEGSGPTFYSRNGDVFSLACSILASFFVLSAMISLLVHRR